MKKKETLLRSILTAATILLLMLLVWQCLDIFIAGNNPANLDENGLYINPVYRADDVIARLRSIWIWAVGYLVLLIAVCVMLHGETRKSCPIPMDPDNRLRLMKKKLAALPEAAIAEESLRRRIWLVTGAVVILCAAMYMIFLLNQNHFTSWDLEMVMGQMLLHTVPWILLAFAAVIWASYVCRRSMEREADLLKGVSGTKVPDPVQKPTCLPYVRIALYVLSAMLIVLGIRNGGMRDVLIKAINICTECIGLG